ncbi:hypothetical protein GW17_00033370 [Ensete ventricosum]|nr:hypothetical protein GW17_00033370 [Ensete ventricosum]
MISMSGVKRQSSQHPETPRVAQDWMRHSYSREGAARHSSLAQTTKNSQF